MVVVIAALGAALAAGAVADRAARGHARPRLARAAQRARRRPADRGRALRLARGDPRALRPAARARAASCGRSSPCGVDHEPLPYSIGRVAGWISEVAIDLPPAGLPVRTAPGPRRPGARLAGGRCCRAALRADRVARRPAFPAPSHLGHVQCGLPGERRSASSTRAGVGQRRRDPGARGALVLLPLLVLWPARGPADARDAADAARAAPVLVVAMLRMFTLARVDRRAPRRRRRRGPGVADRRAVAHAAARVARVPRRARCAGGSTPPTRCSCSRTGSASRRTPRRATPHGPGGEGPVARPRLRPPGRSTAGSTAAGWPVGAARTGVRTAAVDVHQRRQGPGRRDHPRRDAARAAGVHRGGRRLRPRLGRERAARRARRQLARRAARLARADPRRGRRRAPADRARPPRRRPAAAGRAADPAPARRGDDGPQPGRRPRAAPAAGATTSTAPSTSCARWPPGSSRRRSPRTASATRVRAASLQSPVPVNVVIKGDGPLPRGRRDGGLLLRAWRRSRTSPSTRRTRPRRRSCSSSTATSCSRCATTAPAST